jgi:hypothetical protein
MIAGRPAPGPRAPLRLALAAVVMLAVDGGARAQDCESMSGPARTDCFIGRARIQGGQSDIAAGAARVQADEQYLRAATGTGTAPTPRRVKPRKAPPP